MFLLAGSDKHSYGYNADSGNICNSTGNHNGIPYGPSYTTGDVVGCGINLVDNSCFYTKNGVHLGKSNIIEGKTMRDIACEQVK